MAKTHPDENRELGRKTVDIILTLQTQVEKLTHTPNLALRAHLTNTETTGKTYRERLENAYDSPQSDQERTTAVLDLFERETKLHMETVNDIRWAGDKWYKRKDRRAVRTAIPALETFLEGSIYSAAAQTANFLAEKYPRLDRAKLEKQLIDQSVKVYRHKTERSKGRPIKTSAKPVIAAMVASYFLSLPFILPMADFVYKAWVMSEQHPKLVEQAKLGFPGRVGELEKENHPWASPSLIERMKSSIKHKGDLFPDAETRDRFHMLVTAPALVPPLIIATGASYCAWKRRRNATKEERIIEKNRPTI